MTTEYDRRVAKKLRRKLLEQEYIVNYGTNRPRDDEFILPPELRTDWWSNPYILSEIVKHLPKPLPVLDPSIFDRPGGTWMEDSPGEDTGIWSSGPFRWGADILQSFYEMERDTYTQMGVVGKKIMDIPVIGGILEGLPYVFFMSEFGISPQEIARAVPVLMDAIKNNPIVIGRDIQRYGFVDAMKYNILKRLGTYINVIEYGGAVPIPLTFEQFYPDSVKSDITKGIGDDRITNFASIKKPKNLDPSAEEFSLTSRVAHIAYEVPYNRPGMIDTYTYSESHSDKNIVVYIDYGTGDMLVGIRGTDFTDPRDMMADLRILTKTESESEMFQTTLARVEKIIDFHNTTYGETGNIYVAGHSLGGQLVNFVFSEPSLADNIYMGTALAPGSAPKFVDILFPGEDQPEDLIERRGHDVSQLYQMLTGEADILSRTEGKHYTPGTLLSNESFGHSEWDRWEDSQFWRDNLSTMRVKKLPEDVIDLPVPPPPLPDTPYVKPPDIEPTDVKYSHELVTETHDPIGPHEIDPYIHYDLPEKKPIEHPPDVPITTGGTITHTGTTGTDDDPHILTESPGD